MYDMFWGFIRRSCDTLYWCHYGSVTMKLWWNRHRYEGAMIHDISWLLTLDCSTLKLILIRTSVTNPPHLTTILWNYVLLHNIQSSYPLSPTGSLESLDLANSPPSYQLSTMASLKLVSIRVFSFSLHTFKILVLRFSPRTKIKVLRNRNRICYRWLFFLS